MPQAPRTDELRGRRREDSAYERGVRDGEVQERLRTHDEHFQHVDTAIEAMAASIRGLSDELRADRAARGATQVAQEEYQARMARKLEQSRTRDQIRMNFWSKLGVVVVSACAVGSLILSALSIAHVI